MPLALLIVVLALGAAATRAEGGNAGGEQRGRPLLPAKSNAAWQEECSGCHIAYAPGLLGAASWRKIMSGLDQHFGVDASLPAASNTEITAFLAALAAIWIAAPIGAGSRGADGRWQVVFDNGHAVCPPPSVGA